MSATNVCRLCLTRCSDLQSLYDKTGQTNETYDITIQFFHPMYLNVSQGNHLTGLCLKCWHIIEEFHQFQLTVFQAQQKLLEDDSEMEFVSMKSEDVSQDDTATYEILYKNEDSISLPDIELMEDVLNGETTQEDCYENIDNEPRSMESASEDKENAMIIPISDSEDSDDNPTTIYEIKEQSKRTSIRKQRACREELDTTIAQWKEKLECALCGYALTNFTLLRLHFKQKHPSVKCHIICCDRKFDARCSIERHARFHMGTSYIQCVVCKATYEDFSLLKTHQTAEHPKDDCYVLCCRRKYYEQVKYEEHLRHHLKSPAYTCEICGKPQSNRQNLKMHMHRLHSKSKMNNPYSHISLERKRTPLELDVIIARIKPQLECGVCNAPSDTFTLLQEHFINDHPNVYCHIICCQRKLKTRYAIEDHLRLHVDPDAFKCKTCGNNYQTKKALADHVLFQHTEDDKK